MRRDILINVENNDLKLTNSFRPTATFRLQSVAEQVYGEILVEEGHQWETYLQSQSVSVVLPYLPYSRPLAVRIAKVAAGGTSAMQATSYSTVVAKGGKAVSACALSSISRDNFILVSDGGNLVAYSGDDLDFSIGNANSQNKAALLACMPGNNYRYPTIGVGLSNWIGAPSNLPGLAQKLMQEFEADGTPVVSARYSQADKTLYLNLDTHNVDANEDL